MIVAVGGVSLEALVNYLAPFFELRRKEFVERLKWDLVVIDGLEIDEFDTNEAVYLLLIDSVLGLVGGMRFLPTTRPNMIKDVFSEYLYPGCEAPLSPKIIESTRFFIADDYKTGGLIGVMKRPAVELLLAMIEYAIAIGQEKIATFLYSSLKTSIQWSLGWAFSPLSDAFILKEDQGKAFVKKKSSFIGEYPVNEAVLEKIRAKVGLYKPMLHSTTVVEVSDLEAFLISQNYSLFPKKSPKKSLSIKRGFSKEGTMCMK